MKTNMQTRSMTKTQQTMTKQTITEQPSEQLSAKVKSISPPKNKYKLYEWTEKNLTFYTEDQILEMGLDKNNYNKVMRCMYICGATMYNSPYFAVAPKGYYWEGDTEEYHNLYGKSAKMSESKFEFYKLAMCQCFYLKKVNKNKNIDIYCE